MVRTAQAFPPKYLIRACMRVVRIVLKNTVPMLLEFNVVSEGYRADKMQRPSKKTERSNEKGAWALLI